MSHLEQQLEASLRYVNEKKKQEKAMSTAIERAQDNGTQLARRDDELTVQDLVAQVTKIQEVMHAVMKRDEHYGVIPGTGKKPTLLKAGAEKLCLLFRLDPQYQLTETWDGPHLTVVSTCTLWHITSGQRRGSGMAMCSTRESKYAWRQSARKCPQCGLETIIKGKEEYGGGWLCFKKKGGCGAKFKTGDQSVEGQETGRVPNEDLADTYNTVLKMANKRSLVAAVLNATAASDIFTQDLEDMRHQRDENEAQEASRIQPTDPDDHPDFASDPKELLNMIHESERLLNAGDVRSARVMLGSKARRIEGSAAHRIQIEKEAGNVTHDYYRQLGKEWQRVNRRVDKAEKELTPQQNVTASFIDDDEDDERAAIQEES